MVGDARVHLEHKRVFYVRMIHSDGTVSVSLVPPGSKEIRALRNVSVADWFLKTAPTCDEPVCARCAKQDGALDLCKEHQCHDPPAATT